MNMGDLTNESWWVNESPEDLEGNMFRMPETGDPWVLTTTYRGSVQKPLQIILGVPGSGD